MQVLLRLKSMKTSKVIIAVEQQKPQCTAYSSLYLHSVHKKYKVQKYLGLNISQSVFTETIEQ